MSADERLFALVPLGDAHVLVDAAWVHEIGPASRADGSDAPCVDLASALAVRAPPERHALSVEVGPQRVWLLVEPGTRFVRLPTRAVSPLPAWLPRALISSLAPIGDGWGFELNLHALLERARLGADPDG